jgi:hypothetical protein
MAKFRFFTEAVRYTLDKIGPDTSLAVLCITANKHLEPHYNDPLNKAALAIACTTRKKWKNTHSPLNGEAWKVLTESLRVATAAIERLKAA